MLYSLTFFTVGLDAAGKTTILYKLKLGEIVTTIPTIGTASYVHIVHVEPKHVMCSMKLMNVSS